MPNKTKYIFFFHASADLYGSDYVLLELIKKTLQHYKVIVFLPKYGPLVDELIKCNAEVIVSRMAVLRKEYLSIKGIFTFLFNIISSLYTVYHLQKKHNVEIFHSNTSAVWSGFLSAWLFRKKHFWQIMEIIESPRLVSRLMSKVVGKFSDKVFCISDAVKNHFLKFNGDRKNKFITLYHGVDRNIYNMKNIDRDLIRQGLGVDDDVVLIGFAGRYNAWKGQEVLAEAAKYILTTISNSVKIHFLFLGSVYADQHHYEYQLRDILQSNEQIKSHSTMLGFQKDFHNWLGSMDIVVLPSKLPEPNATVIVAAMTLGIPVVGTNIGGTVESVSDGMTGYLVPPNDPQALAVKICDLVNSPEKRLLFGDNSLLRANTMFSIDNYTATVLRSYENVFTL